MNRKVKFMYDVRLTQKRILGEFVLFSLFGEGGNPAASRVMSAVRCPWISAADCGFVHPKCPSPRDLYTTTPTLVAGIYGDPLPDSGGNPWGHPGGHPGGKPSGHPGGHPRNTPGDTPGNTPEDYLGGTPGDIPGIPRGDSRKFILRTEE